MNQTDGIKQLFPMPFPTLAVQCTNTSEVNCIRLLEKAYNTTSGILSMSETDTYMEFVTPNGVLRVNKGDWIIENRDRDPNPVKVVSDKYINDHYGDVESGYDISNLHQMSEFMSSLYKRYRGKIDADEQTSTN